jgi:hypothetical protein
MNDTGTTLVRVILLVPACSAALLAVLPDDRMTARLNVDSSSSAPTRGPF